MTNRQTKQEKFKNPKKNNTTLIYVIAAVVILAGIGGAFLLNGKDSNAQAAFNVGSPVTYQQSVEMTDVENTVNNGKVAIDLEQVKKAGIIYTEYNQNGKKVALTAWVAQTGDLIAAVSMCEPCRGYKFHIEGTELVCNACGTRWTLDKLQGVSGGCLTYPPDSLKYEVVNGKILLDEAEIQAWQPRA